MTIDIENYFNRAINLTEYWSIENLFSTARILQKKMPGTLLEWDCQDLEYWSDFTGLKIYWFLIGHDEKTWLSIEKDKKKVAYLRIVFEQCLEGNPIVPWSNGLTLPIRISMDVMKRYSKIIFQEDWETWICNDFSIV